MKASRVVLVLFNLMMTIASLADYLPGTWELLVENVGISSMHTVVTRFNTVMLLDHTNPVPSRMSLPKYYSAIFDPSNKRIRPLHIITDTLCSSGQFLPDGTLLQTGGFDDGIKKIRRFNPCKADDTNSSCSWEELKDIELAHGRWYATNQILPDGTMIIVGGLGAASVEYFPPRAGGVVNFPFLADPKIHKLYPYVHLLPNGHLFVFEDYKSILYDYTNNIVLKNYPELKGGPRNYPYAGSSVMLALNGDYSSATIVVCGGAQYGAMKNSARITCGRIEATQVDPVWEMEDMPMSRIMGDMVMLPTGHVLIINGAQAGSQGYDMASKPCLNPVLYTPDKPVGYRFKILSSGSVPRMYHSTANLLPDGRVLLAGSNAHYLYNFTARFPTELRIESFSPEYLSPKKGITRPTIINLPERIHYGQGFHILVKGELPADGMMEVNIASAPFVTHSFSQGQRLVKLSMVSIVASRWPGSYILASNAPPNGKVAPPGYYMVFVVNKGVPSVAKWVQLL